MRLGALEAGGTKMVCAVGDENGNIEKRIIIPTEDPAVTMPKMIRFFQSEHVEALGIACFGPVDLDTASPSYGCITSTPKISWRDYNIVRAFKDALLVPIGFDTDVNGAALGETVWGAAKGAESAVYITIGTGVGVGICINGKPLHGMMHPEAGHILVRRHPDDTYIGHCPYHHDCLEGLAAGPAIEDRYGQRAAELAGRDDVWDMEACYIAQALAVYILTLSPNKIILWGGVMHQEQLFPLVRRKTAALLKGYVQTREIINDMDQYIVPPALGDDPGIKGALYLSVLALRS